MANGRTINEDLKMVIVRVKGHYTIELTGVWCPKDIKFTQKFITDQYRFNRKLIVAAFNKSQQKFKDKHADLKVRERDIKHKENELKITAPPPSPLEVMASEGAKKLNQKIGQADERSITKSGTGLREQSSGANTNRNTNQEVAGDNERDSQGQQPSASSVSPDNAKPASTGSVKAPARGKADPSERKQTGSEVRSAG